MLQQAYEKLSQNVPRSDELEKILMTSVNNYTEVFLLVDALDESPENDEVQQNVLIFLERLARNASTLKIFATSRKARDIGDSMGSLGASPVPIATRSVDADIRRYVSMELSRDKKLSNWEQATKALIEDTFAQKADGM